MQPAAACLFLQLFRATLLSATEANNRLPRQKKKSSTKQTLILQARQRLRKRKIQENRDKEKEKPRVDVNSGERLNLRL